MDKNQIRLKKGVRPIYFKDAEIKDVDQTKREVHILLNSFGNVDDDRDRVHKGAFAKSLAERGPESDTNRKIAWLKFHKMEMPIGTWLKLWESDRGLEGIGLVDKTDEGNKTLIQIESKSLNQASIGFEYIWDKIEYDDAKDVYDVKELNLWEGSMVVLGSNPLTGVLETSGKEFDDIVAEAMGDLEKHLKGIEDYKSQFNIRKLFAKLLALAEYGAKPSKDTLRRTNKPQIKVINLVNVLTEVLKSQTIKS